MYKNPEERNNMAKAKKVKEKSLEQTLWDSCNKLRGSMSATEYMYFVLGLVFLKFADLKFEARRQELLNSETDKEFIEIPSFYKEKGVFFVPTESRYSYLIAHKKDSNIGQLTDNAFSLLEKSNKETLGGCLPTSTYGAKVTVLGQSKFASLLDEINKIHTDEMHPMADLIGQVYQYFINKFAVSSADEKGEFYTPETIVNLITDLIEPFEGKIYDPCCGSGGMFIQSYKFVKSHQGNAQNVSVYGQEYSEQTWKLAKMNLAIRGIPNNLGIKQADTFADDLQKTLKADYIIANPPFNSKDWRGEEELTNDPRWSGYKVPPVSNANYAWILHMLYHLSYKGVAGFLLANGALNADGDEKAIREQLIKNDKIEAIIVLPREMFYYTDISVTLWIMRNYKGADVVKKGNEERRLRNRQGEILFMDLRTKGHYSKDRYKELSPEEVDQAKNTYFNWQSVDKDKLYKDIPEFCKSVKTSDLIDYSLVPSKYIQFIDHDLDIDFPKEMKRIQGEMKELLKEEKESQKRLEDAFEGIGYGIK